MKQILTLNLVNGESISVCQIRIDKTDIFYGTEPDLSGSWTPIRAADVAGIVYMIEDEAIN